MDTLYLMLVLMGLGLYLVVAAPAGVTRDDRSEAHVLTLPSAADALLLLPPPPDTPLLLPPPPDTPPGRRRMVVIVVALLVCWYLAGLVEPRQSPPVLGTPPAVATPYTDDPLGAGAYRAADAGAPKDAPSC